MSHELEIASGARFNFGANWSRFVSDIDAHSIDQAEASLRDMLEVENLRDKSFVDIGSGSGLFSLAAKRLGARVLSFDYDPRSVACTRSLLRQHFGGDPGWRVVPGSVLDREFLDRIGQFDIVYSWGVLHHTGRMWEGLNNAALLVKPGGSLFVAIYNHQPIASRYWSFVKRTYNKSVIARLFWSALHSVYPLAPSLILRWLEARKLPRGMSAWRDLHDWIGGYPFEVAKPEQVFEFCRSRGLTLTKLVTVGGRMGCNEFVFHREWRQGVSQQIST